MTDRQHDPAFGSLEDRANAMAGGDPLDRISLRDHVVSVEIGAFQSERDTTQRLSFSVVVEVAQGDGAAKDDVDKILSYDTITNAIAIELAAERLNLLETLAERIAARLLIEPQARRVFIRIEKLDRGPGALGVEIVRAGREGQLPQKGDAGVAPPLVVSMDQSAIYAPHLGTWLDQLENLGRAVLVTMRAEAPIRQAVTPPAQERIDLLELEQVAWQLAARDQRLAVVDSRTEFAHAIQTGLMAVWAPSRIVLDAVEKPPFDIGDMAQLNRWFAREHGALGLLSIGGAEGLSVDIAELDLGAIEDV